MQNVARSVDRSSPLPLWAQVHADLQRRVDAGEFQHSFPGELALTSEYAVSRQTVREALRRMREGGIVVAERGRPPRLAAGVGITQPVGALYSLFASVEAAGMTQHSIVRALDVRTDEAVAIRLERPGDARLLYLERVRLADDIPLAVDQIWLPAELTTPLLAADFTHTALYDELALRCGIRLSGGEENIRAVIPNHEEQHVLQSPDGVAAFAIERRANFHDRPTEWRQTLVRADRFSVSARFSQRTGYELTTSTATPPRPVPARPTRRLTRNTSRKAARA